MEATATNPNEQYFEIDEYWWEKEISNDGTGFHFIHGDTFFLQFDSEKGRVILQAEGPDVGNTCYQMPLPKIKTRGQLRRLIAALEGK